MRNNVEKWTERNLGSRLDRKWLHLLTREPNSKTQQKAIVCPNRIDDSTLRAFNPSSCSITTVVRYPIHIQRPLETVVVDMK